MGVAAMGVSIYGPVFVPLAHHLISDYGWGTAGKTIGAHERRELSHPHNIMKLF